MAPCGAVLTLVTALTAPAGFAQRTDPGTIAITDVTVIDGTGAAPRRGVTVLVEDGRIASLDGSGDGVGDGAGDVPANADRIDGRGKYLLPGFIDSNVHATIYGNSTRRETVVKYGDHNDRLALEFAQRQLKYGVTTVRDSYGALEPLLRVRDRIEAGDAIGARLLVAGNIVGWGGPFSLTFSLMPESDLTMFQATWNDHIAQGVGEELMDMGPEEIRVAINRYLDKGPDFIKYGGTSHFFRPSLITFSPRVQKVIVDETHRRGLIAETHATSPEALRLAVEAGVDLIQHPEILTREYPDDLIDLIVERDVICALRSNTLTAAPWQRHLAAKERATKEQANAGPPRTAAERREREADLELGYEIERRNAEKLIARGCRVTIATDNYQGRAPEFRKAKKPEIHEAGIGSILAIEGLVELGMSEMDAIVAATHNGAIAAGMADRIGTIEVGKEADLVLLSADPLDDISNIRRLEAVIARGRRIDTATLPEEVFFYTGELPAGATRASIDNAVPRRQPAGALVSDSGSAAAASASVSDATDASRASSPGSATTPTDADRSALPIRQISTTVLGKYVVELENGELWRQLDADNTPIAIPADGTDLTAEIKQSFFGTTTVKISGTYRAFKATRIDNDNN